MLINTHLDALLKTPAATRDVRKLRTFYDTLEGYIYRLEALGVYSESHGDFLVPMVMKKLREEVRRVITRSHDE